MSRLTAFVFAHPGHEFRLLHTLSDGPATLDIFTKGSRAATCTGRIDASRKLARDLGIITGPIFGPTFDRNFYDALLDADADFFSRLIDQLTDSFFSHSVSRVIVDSWQNYNPIHDLTHLCGRLAAARFEAATGRTLPVFDYPVVFGDLAAAPIGPVASAITLDDAQVAAKLATIRNYPDIDVEATALIRMDSQKALRVETLHHPLPLEQLFPTLPPLYEAYGRQRVASGSYTEVITWAHVQKIVTALTSQSPRNLFSEAA